MREPISSNPASGTTRFQVESPAQSFIELLGVADYERQDVATQKPVPMAQVSWSTAEVLRNASNLAFAIEAHSCGMKLVAAKNILAGNVLQNRWPSGKKKHRKRAIKS